MMDTARREYETARQIAEAVSPLGGTAYLVGGCVRDRLRGAETKDIDLEVHGISPEKLEKILDSFGDRITIGESFGIYSLKGLSLDIAMPRKEKCLGRGHRDFAVSVDPFIGTYGAAMRRDFTVNALMENVLTGEITDHFGGRKDLECGILRHVNTDTFGEDPLRVLRAAQFAARFGFSVAEETLSLCQSMDLSSLARERVMAELEKALLQAAHPSVFFETLRKMNQLHGWFPELSALIGVPQNPRFHAEGDVWIHTMMVVDEAAPMKNRTVRPDGFMLAALSHDFGKAVCTETVSGEIHAYGHESLGIPLAEAFLNRLTAEQNLRDYVLSLVRYHMVPNILAEHRSAVRKTNRLYDSVPDPEALIFLAESDARGKIPPWENPERTSFLLERLKTYRETMERPYVTGKDLIDAGIQPCEQFRDYLSYAHKLRLAGIKRENALRETLAYIRRHPGTPPDES